MAFYKRLLKYQLFIKIRDILLFFRDYSKNHEIKRSYGRNNPDKTFYVIRNYTKEAGWGSIINYVCLHLEYALDKGYIPVVDMCNYHSAYEVEGEFGKVNVWEKFFYQVSDYSLDEVYSSRNVILCSSKMTSRGYIACKDLKWEAYSKICEKYIRLKDDIRGKIDCEILRVTDNGTKKVLGVLCRGTDYTMLKPLHHGIPYSSDEVIEDIRARLSGFDRVYLATEDSQILNAIKEAFSEECLFYSEQERYSPLEVDGYLADVSRKMEIDPVKKGIDYLTVLFTISQCDAFCGAPCGGSYISILLNGGKYIYSEILSKGEYT